MQNFNWQRTDLIDESEEVVVHQTKEQKEKLEQSSGIQIEDRNAGRVKITDVLVDAEGEKQIGKKVEIINIGEHVAKEAKAILKNTTKWQNIRNRA